MPRSPRFALLLFALALFILPARAQDLAADIDAEIDALLGQYHETGQFNGTALVAQDGAVIFKKGYGAANMEWDLPNAPDVKFRLGSITKQFTAVLILQLVGEGQLALDDPLAKHLPDYPAAVAEKVTVHHLLNHTSGIKSYTGMPNFFAEVSRNPYTPDDFIATFANEPLDFEPGTEWRYNNSGYFLLGVLVEKLTGMSYEDALRARILDPLGMDDTGYDHHGTLLEKRAAGYERQGYSYINAPYLDMSLPYAAGSLYSTVEDLFTWDRALYTDAVLSADLKEKMFTPYMNDYGYGWAIGTATVGDEAVGIIEHGGGINGFNTLISRVPDEEHLIVFLNNTGGTDLGAMRDGVLALLYGEAPAPPKPGIGRVLWDTIEADGVAAALARYDRLKANDPDGYNFGERELNTLGYHLLGIGRVEEAILVFEKNVMLFPEAANPHDSLGEAYAVKGDTEMAIRHYRHALERNPASESARQALIRLGVPEAELAPPEVTLPEATLARYVGDYQLGPGFILSVTREGQRLFAQATGQPKFELFASSETRFFVKQFNAQMSFYPEGDGPAPRMTLHQGGRDMPAPRVEPGG